MAVSQAVRVGSSGVSPRPVTGVWVVLGPPLLWTSSAAGLLLGARGHRKNVGFGVWTGLGANSSSVLSQV